MSLVELSYIVLGTGVGCWMYAFVNHRWNKDRWTGSKPFFWLGLAAIIIAILVLLTR